VPVKASELAALGAVERDHWFYRGKRDIVRYWINALAPLGPEDLLVDVGAGTGQLLLEMGHSCRAVGVEFTAAGLGYLSGKNLRVIRGSITALPVHSNAAAVVTALDVLEHVGDDGQALSELIRIVRPGGLVILHVPAFELLWSDWDRALGHKRRYSRPALLRLAGRFAVDVRRCVYVNTAVFLPVLTYRWLRSAFPTLLASRLEDTVPPRPVNHLLHRLYVAPACWRRVSAPLGVSVLCILEKRQAS
jgi:SAM-dependent methyltransferase